MCKCPKCSSSFRRKVRRNFLTKITLPTFKLYKCYYCKTTYLYSYPLNKTLKHSGSVEKSQSETEFENNKTELDYKT